MISNPKPTVLSQIPAADPKAIDMAISTSKGSSKKVVKDDPDSEGLMLAAETGETDDGKGFRKWVVQRKVIDSFTKLPKLTELGTFELAEEKLTFLWNMEAPDWAKANSLQFCVLEISHGNQSHRFRLSKPKRVPTEKYELASRNQKFYLAVNPNAVDEPKDLFLDVQLSGVASQPLSKLGLKIGETARFGIKREDFKSGNGTVEFDLTLQYDGARPFIEVNAHTFRKVLITTDNRQNKVELARPDTRQRNNAHLIPMEEMRFSTIVADFERIADASKKIAKSLEQSTTLRTKEDVDIPRTERTIRSLRNDLKDADAQERADIEAEISALESQQAEMQEVVDGYKRAH